MTQRHVKEEKSSDYNHDQYVTTQGFNKLTAETLKED